MSVRGRRAILDGAVAHAGHRSHRFDVIRSALVRSRKNATLNLRVAPELKAALRCAADREHRSVANLVEVLVRDHCARVGIRVASSTDGPDAADGAGADRPATLERSGPP